VLRSKCNPELTTTPIANHQPRAIIILSLLQIAVQNIPENIRTPF
jgi:hypothetical protein